VTIYIDGLLYWTAASHTAPPDASRFRMDDFSAAEYFAGGRSHRPSIHKRTPAAAFSSCGRCSERFAYRFARAIRLPHERVENARHFVDARVDLDRPIRVRRSGLHFLVIRDHRAGVLEQMPGENGDDALS